MLYQKNNLQNFALFNKPKKFVIFLIFTKIEILVILTFTLISTFINTLTFAIAKYIKKYIKNSKTLYKFSDKLTLFKLAKQS